MARMRSERVRVTGPLGPFATGFREDLGGQGYRSGENLLVLMAGLSSWMAAEDVEVIDLSRTHVETFMSARRVDRRPGASMRAIAPLIDHLVGIGAVPAWGPPAAGDSAGMLIERYAAYLHDQRALAAPSIRNYVGVARQFLSFLADQHVEVGAVTAADVIEFVVAEAGRGKVASAKAMTTRLRSLLRFVHVEGVTSVALVGAVPSVASWRLTSLPKALPARGLRMLLCSCDRRTAVGRRDFAIMTVLSRLGLRAGEVARLGLDDIDWRAGELVVHGKGARLDKLPLPVDAGEAIVAWLERGRPRCTSRSVFVRVRAPHRGLSGGGVSAVVRRACERSGLSLAGAHRLRHTAATEMLAAGASLADIGHVLRQDSSEVTSIYAKVDRGALAAVVRPWPKVAS
jgi:site-specific recombinase XerD